MKKILKITAKAILGIFLFYLFICLVVVPIGLAWGIRAQGTKLLKNHPVQVRSVFFNPFLLRLSINGLKILDEDRQVMSGFDRFSVDVSFLRLFKKEIRVESVAFDGLKANVVLLPDGKMNFLALMPQSADASKAPASAPEQTVANEAAPSGQAKTAKAAPVLPGDLPFVIVDSITIKRGTVNVIDKSVEPNFSSVIDGIDLRVTGVSTKPDCRVKVVFEAKLNEKGTILFEALIDPFVVPMRVETTFSLNNHVLRAESPYVGKYTGRAVGDGKLDLNMTYRISDNKITGSHKLLIQRFGFGEKVESKDALNLPFGLAIALLEDPQGRINISLPVSGDMADPKFKYSSMIFGVVKNFFMKLVTSPFKFLMSMMGSDSGTEEMGSVRFSPGKTELVEEEKTKLGVLIKALQERPKLMLEVNGSYDPIMDWDAVKMDIFNKDYESLSKQVKGNDNLLYKKLYQRHFGLLGYWNFTKEMKAKEPAPDQAGIDQELRRRIIDNVRFDKLTLEAFAQARAKAVYDFIIAAGFDSARLKIGNTKETQGSMGFVPLEFTFTVFEKN